jgi:hypothetical protein
LLRIVGGDINSIICFPPFYTCGFAISKICSQGGRGQNCL